MDDFVLTTAARLDVKRPKGVRASSSSGQDHWLTLGYVAVVLFGALLRVARLHAIPPGLFFDEAANLFDVSDILHGAHPVYFPRNNGREPFFFYWVSLFASLWGPTPYAIRLAAAMVGVMTVVTTFLCARELLRAWSDDRRWADRVALVAAFVLSITYVHVHYSRIGLRSISLPLFLALSYGLLFRGLRRNSWWALIFAGVAGGASIYTYIAARIAPLPVLVLPLALGLSRRSWRPFWQVAFVGLIWAVITVPLGVYTIRHPGDVLGHTNDVSILNPVNNHGNPTVAIARGILATLGAFTFVGSGAADQNLPGRPILDPILGFFLFVGAGVLLLGAIGRPGSLRDARATSTTGADRVSDETALGWRLATASFLVVWLLSQSLPSALAVSPPGFIRMTGTLPSVAIIVGIGIGYAWRWIAGRGLRASRAAGLLAVALAVSTAWTVRDYFWLWGPSTTAYQWMMGDKVDSATYLKRWATDERVFLAPLYAQDNTIRFLTRGAAVQTFDLGASLVVPTDRSRDVRYVFPASDQQEATLVSRELSVQHSTTTVLDPTGRFTLLTTLNVSRGDLPPVPTTRLATFDGGIALVAASIAPEHVAPGHQIAITMEWLSLQPQPYDYTVFLHLRDSSNRTVAQVDRQPTAGSIPTTAWRSGDLVWDRYSLAIPANLAPGDYRLVAGLYRLETLQRLNVDLGQGHPPTNEAPIGTVQISAR